MTKRIFITGGASGLGRALAERYARAGWRVAIGDVNEAQLDGVDFYRCDVREIEQLQSVADALVAKWGGVDVVVNNAGVASAGIMDQIPMEEWDRVIDINLMGVVRGCKVFVPMLKKQKSGHIVNIASMAGLLNLPRMSTYNTAKAAVVALSETLRLELAEHGIHVSVVCPSFFRTNLASSLHESMSREVIELTHKWVTQNKIDASTIAEKIFRAVEKRELHVLTHNETKIIWALKRVLPHGVFAGIIKRGEQRFMNGPNGSGTVL
jgi:NAD(P)-dependent dehydrogenase (short-subunit alcohol dehydrogenase family)